MECAYKVYKELRDIVNKVELIEVNRYQKLKYKIQDVMEKVLDKCLSPTTEMIINLIEIENSHINTNHPDFIKHSDILIDLFQGEQEARQNQEPFLDKPQPNSLLNQRGRNLSKSPIGREAKEETKQHSSSQQINTSSH